MPLEGKPGGTAWVEWSWFGTRTDGQPFAYPKPGALNGPFLALGDPAAQSRLPALPA